MFWTPCLGCDEANCHRTSGERIEPLISAAGFRTFEIDGEQDGREYTGLVLLCPEHTKRMEDDIAKREQGEEVRGLFFKSFRGGRKREPDWVEVARG